MKTDVKKEHLRQLPALLLFVAAPALAQDAEIQKQLIQRQQQSDAFTLQLRQSQEALKVPPGDLQRRQDLESRQLNERQGLDNVSARQLIEVKPDTPQELRPIERQRAADERAPLTIPSGGIVQPVENPR
jgi:multidrug resistance efflux pump